MCSLWGDAEEEDEGCSDISRKLTAKDNYRAVWKALHLEAGRAAASRAEPQGFRKKYRIVAIIDRNSTILEVTFGAPFILLRKDIYWHYRQVLWAKLRNGGQERILQGLHHYVSNPKSVSQVVLLGFFAKNQVLHIIFSTPQFFGKIVCMFHITRVHLKCEA